MPAWTRSGLRQCALAITLIAGGITAGCEHDGSAETALPVHVAFGEVGTSPGQFVYPRAMDTQGDTLWVVDKQAKLQRINPETGECLASFTMPEYLAGKPTGVTVAPLAWDATGSPLAAIRDDNLGLYVPDTHYHRVMVYAVPSSVDAKVSPIKSWGGYGKGPGQFTYPTDVAVLTNARSGKPATQVERIYVSEYGGNDRVSVFNAQAEFLFAFGAFGEASHELPGEVLFNRPQSIVVDGERQRLVVSDAGHQRLGVFDLDGTVIRWIGEGWSSPGGAGTAAKGATPSFKYPYGLALLDDGTVLVAEFGASHVRRIDVEAGTLIETWGQRGRDVGALAYPWAVAACGGVGYVLDSGNNRVQAFNLPRIVAGRGR